MATTQTEAERKAAEATPKIKEVPAEIRQRMMRGEPEPKIDKAKEAAEAAAKAAQEAAAAEAKAKADREAAEKEEGRKKKPKADLPPIPEINAQPAITRSDVERIVADKTSPAQPAAPKLAGDDQNDLELAEFAARQHSDRYGDLPKKVTAWFAARDEFLAAKAKEFGGRESAEFRDFVNGDEFRSFVRQNAPTYQRGDAKKIYEEFIEERGAQRARKLMEPELNEVKRRQLAIEQAPIIERTVTQGLGIMLKDTAATPDEALAEFSRDPAAFLKANEVEGSIIYRHATFFKQAMEETLRITSGLVDVASLERPNETQQWIDSFITKKERELETKYPNGAQMADGKILVSGAQMKRLEAARVGNLASYRTMLPGEIVGAIAVEGQNEIKAKLEEERRKLERSGFARVKKPEPAANGATTHPSAPVTSPMAGSAPARGAAAAPPAPAEPYWKKYVTGKEA